jgi:tRNA uridine 5-carbamoylmethylation protein Kti12
MKVAPQINDIIVQVYGNPGSGKTAFAQWLKTELSEHNFKVTVYDDGTTTIIIKKENLDAKPR